MKRLSTSVLVVILLVTMYILCISAYTFISRLSNINYFDRKVYPEYEAFSRVRRTLAENNDTRKNDIEFNICCDRDEYLNTELECVKLNVTKEDTIGLLSSAAVVDKDLTQGTINPDRIGFKYKFKDLCTRDEMRVIIWSEGQIYSHYISQVNGYLLELSQDRMGFVSNFSTSSFCLDAMAGPENSSIYVALLCPCKEKVCVPKCCPEGFYYNTATSSCKQNGIEPYKPNLPQDMYYLVHNVPDCEGPDRMIIADNEFSPLNILENGQLVSSTNQNTTFDRKKYCIDMFSNGNRNLSYVNGFYCPNIILSILKTGILPENVHEIQHFSNTNASKSVRFEFFLILLCSFCSIL